MPVRVVHVGRMRVVVAQSLVTMRVCMWLAGWIIGTVDVLMMLVVHVRVPMLHGLVLMVMLVLLGQMQPHADGHQDPGDQQL